MAKKGIVYALTNPEFRGLVRIGRVYATPSDKGALNALNSRLRVHSSASVPAPYELHYAVFTDDVKSAERNLLDAFESRRREGKTRRDFFRITVKEAEAAMKLLLIGGKLTEDMERRIRADRPDFKAVRLDSNRVSPRRKGKAYKFADARIKQGHVLTCLHDRKIKVEVSDTETQKVRFITKGFSENPMSLRKATLEVFRKIKHRGVNWKGIRGALYWEYKGKTLGDIFANLRD